MRETTEEKEVTDESATTLCGGEHLNASDDLWP